MRPTVSVAMSVYNGTWCIEGALDSLMAQTVRPDEILVCDDGSTDGTPELVERKYGGAVTVLRLPHRNSSATRSIGLARATGDWLAFMDADDTWLPHKLERQLEYLRDHPDVRHLSTDGIYVSAEGVLRPSWLSDYFRPVRTLHGDLFPLLIDRCFILMSSVMMERGAYRDVGGINPHIVYSHDYDLWLRATARYPAAVMAEPLTTYFSSPNALSRRYEARHRDDLELMRQVERGFYRRDPVLQRRGAERAAALEYRLGLRCIQSGRVHEGRERLRRASLDGPVPRRLMALAGSFLPDWAVEPLRRSAWLKRSTRLEDPPGPTRPTPLEHRGAA